MEILGPILEFVNMIWTPIGKCLKYHRSLEENMENVKGKLEELNCRKEDIESKMSEELSSRKNPKKEVELWLREVQRINGEMQTLEQEVEKIKYLSRARLGKRVSTKFQEVEALHEKGSFSDGLVVDAPPSNGETLPTTTLAGETTIRKNMEEIWDCLMNDEIRLIGVYGMGGAGKTTVMKHINNRLLKETDKFESVIWVTVSKVHDVIKLQDGIARKLNKDLSGDEDETTRASKLFDMLTERKKHVIIFDDVWEEFQLENVGIPEPTLDNGCKIVLTTRSLEVCRRMNCKDIKWKLLSKEEAWNFFLDKVGRDVLLTQSLEAIMKLVAEECARLPLAIITIAGSMKGVVDECEWRNALKELRESTRGLNDMGKVLEQLKYSYIHLKDEKLQHCLLYCALYPEDFKIQRMVLIEYLIVEGIIEGTSRQAEFDKGHSMLNKLENACLLESVVSKLDNTRVKMHDLIRDMALQIMGRGCMVKAGVQLRDLPDEEQWIEDLERVSLMSNYIREIRSGASPRCSGLSTLLLSRNANLERIPNSFFVHMCGLRVLDLSHTAIENLPNSISDLENLTALLLGRCRHLKYVPSLAKLRSLRKLDLSCTGIEEVPQGTEMLVSLRSLNLYANKYLKMLPVGILPKLSRLQFLIVDWRSKTLKVNGEEVAGLRKLETFAGMFYDLHNFNTYVKSLQGRGPRKYLLLVGPSDPDIYFDKEGVFKKNKYVVLSKCSISKGGEDPLVLPNNIEELQIRECHDATSLCNVSSFNNATNFLRYCNIIMCDGMECVLSSSSSSSYGTPLQSLQQLRLSKLPNLRVLFRGEGASPPLPGTFSHLKELFISGCPKIKKLFTPGLLPHLPNLEVIDVRFCDRMEEIIAAKAKGEGEEEEQQQQQRMGESSNHSNVNNDDTIITVTLPKLRFLRLSGLPELKSIICIRVVMVCDSLQHLTVYYCPKLKRLPLSLPMLNGQPYPPPALQDINVDNQEWWESLEWDYPYAKDVFQPFVCLHRH